MDKKQIDRKIWERLYSMAQNIDPIELIGGIILEDENRPLTKIERRDANGRFQKIRKEILKKSKQMIIKDVDKP